MPYFAHVSLILAPDRSKLSKRHGATSVGQVIFNHYYLSSHTHTNKIYIEKLGMRSSCAFFVLISLFLLAFLLIRRTISDFTTIYQFKEMGYLPQAMVNYLALLGWGDGTENEFFTLEQLGK